MASDLRWECPIKPFKFGDVTVVPLTDPVALTEEAIALRHCADTWVNACAEGQAQVFGIRDATDGRRLATLALRRTSDTFELEDLRRLANQPPTENDDDVAKAVVDRINEAIDDGLLATTEREATDRAPWNIVDELLATLTSRPELPMAPDETNQRAEAKWRRMNLPHALDVVRRNPGLTVEEALRHIEDMGF